jgi:hypothetical protein
MKAPRREDHLEDVKLLLCRGFDRATILRYAGQENWKTNDDQIDALITTAEEELAAEALKIDPETEFGKAIARLNHLYMSAQKVQDFKTALAIQKEINKLLALKMKPRTPAASQPASERPRLTIVAK